MTIGTLCLTIVAMSASRRSLLLWTIWFTANGADRRSGCMRSYAANVSVVSASQSSSSDAGRALSAGIDPTTPALHCSITSFGLLMMNIGEQMTGSESCLASERKDVDTLETGCGYGGVPAYIRDCC
jgi:hypothetical protein